MFYLNLHNFQFRELFGCKVTNSRDFVRMKLKSMEYLLTFWHGNEKIEPPYMCVDDEILHRVFLANDDGHKIISYGFEFLIKTYERDLNKTTNYITNYNYIGQKGVIGAREISNALSILNTLTEPQSKLYWNLNIESNIPISSIEFFEYILQKEPGYIRYDDDIIGEKPLIHPRYHFDINFSFPVHYKIGLHRETHLNDIITALDINKECPMAELNPSKTYYVEKILLNKYKNMRKKNHKKR
jgi:hypothetical protein